MCSVQTFVIFNVFKQCVLLQTVFEFPISIYKLHKNPIFDISIQLHLHVRNTYIIQLYDFIPEKLIKALDSKYKSKKLFIATAIISEVVAFCLNTNFIDF